MKAWLKGGLTGALAFAIVEVLYVILCPRCVGTCQLSSVCQTFSFLSYIFGGNIKTAIIFIMVILAFVLVGALVGLILGNRRGKK
jgi:hypothetical protein